MSVIQVEVSICQARHLHWHRHLQAPAILEKAVIGEIYFSEL